MNAAGNAPIRPQGSPGRRLWLSGGSLFVALVSLWGAEPAVSPVEPTKPAEGTAGGSLLSSNSMQLVALGNQAVRDGKRSNALALFSRALEVNPTNTLALYNRARLNDSEGH